VEDSLRRLRRDHIDLLQLHNGLSESPSGNGLTPARVLDAVVPAFDAMRRAGKIRFAGMTGLGQTAAIRTVLESGAFDTAQIAFNLLNPSAVELRASVGMPQNYEQLSQLAQDWNMGTIGIRVLAGGALSGATQRHPVALGKVDPIGSGDSYAGDVADALRFDSLIDEGHAESLIDLATRYALSSMFSTIVIGFSSLDQIEAAAASASRGPLSAAVTARIAEIQNQSVAAMRGAR
jgi:aryl-alcohol dehydrogenase-like predicted oxidoreductase